jgi:hypothetical protein
MLSMVHRFILLWQAIGLTKVDKYLQILKLPAGPGFTRVQSSLGFLFRGLWLPFDFFFCPGFLIW